VGAAPIFLPFVLGKGLKMFPSKALLFNLTFEPHSNKGFFLNESALMVIQSHGSK
jgi:hypothetical protein